MRKPVLVIHGAGTPFFLQGEVYWSILLGDALGPEYLVSSPLMPDPDNPTYANWAAGIARGLEGTGPLILVGHSLGASLLLKYLSEHRPSRALAGLFLVSTPHWGTPDGDMRELALAPDFARRLPKVPVYLYHCREDPEVPVEHIHIHSRALPHAHVRILDGARHDFYQGLFPELPADILALDGA